MDTKVHPPRVDRLHYVFSGWLGDDIVESFPCFVVSGQLANAIDRSLLTGAELDYVEVSLDPQFEKLFPDIAAQFPAWRWLRPNGQPGVDDFWLDEQAQLHLSESAYELLQQFSVANAEFAGSSD
ncbi:MAG: hypothetical protein GY701_07435 [Sulfitobacter sp.]|nr:hypothetical protein [Sulfitobacter sp.]